MHKTTIAKYTKFSADELQKSLSDPLSCVVAVQLNEILSLRPRDCEHIVKGVRRCVTDKIGRYHPKVNGIVLGFAKIRIENPLSALRLDSPFLHVRAIIDYYVFQPRIGSTLRGTVNYVSKKFVSAMIYRVFNVTVKLGCNNIQQQTVTKGTDITFILKSCDMKSEIPVIEGELVVNGVIPVKIKQEPGVDNEMSSADEEQADSSMESDTVDSNLQTKQKEPVKMMKVSTGSVRFDEAIDSSNSSDDEKKIKVSTGSVRFDEAIDSSNSSDDKKMIKVSTGSVRFDEAIDSSNSSDDEKSLLIKSLMAEVFGDEFTNGESSKKHKEKKKKSSKKKSKEEPKVRIKEEPISTDEEVVSKSSGQNGSTSNVGSGLTNGTNGFPSNGSLTSPLKKKKKKKDQSEGTGKKNKVQIDLNHSVTHIKTEPTESKKKKKHINQ